MTTRRLPVHLDDADVLSRGQQLANAELEYAEAEHAKKRATDEAKQTLEAIGGRISELAVAIRSREEIRDVECIVQKNFSAFVNEVVRIDTGEIVETYPMTEKERQGSLI